MDHATKLAYELKSERRKLYKELKRERWVQREQVSTLIDMLKSERSAVHDMLAANQKEREDWRQELATMMKLVTRSMDRHEGS